MKKIRITLVLSLLICFLANMTVFAEEKAVIKAVQDRGENPVFYVGPMEEEVQSATALVGNVEAKQVSVSPLKEEETSIRTLILLDNSLSMPEKIREKALAMIEEMIASRSTGEEFALACLGEEFEELKGFTDDYLELKQALEGIEFADRETYMTDILYELLEKDYFEYNTGNSFCRIVLICDGVDDNTIGYTNEELLQKLEDYRIPIYTIGVYSKKKTNQEELSALFALSRQTNGQSFLLDDMEILQILEKLAEDRDLVRVEVVPEESSLDGEKKAITLTLSTGTGAIDLKAEQVKISQTKLEEIVPEESKEQITEVVEEVEPERKEDNNKTLIIVIISTIVGGIIITVLAFTIVKLGKKKKEKNILREVQDPFQPVNDVSATEYVGGNSFASEGETLMMFENNRSCFITLTDIDMPAKVFKKELVNRIVIGRVAKETDICLDYDKSISGTHCAIEKRGGVFYLIDLNSSNGTYLNENRVLSQVEVCSGSIIKLGRVKLRIEIG